MFYLKSAFALIAIKPAQLKVLSFAAKEQCNTNTTNEHKFNEVCETKQKIVYTA